MSKNEELQRGLIQAPYAVPYLIRMIAHRAFEYAHRYSDDRGLAFPFSRGVNALQSAWTRSIFKERNHA